MPFRFRLARILKLREREEERRKEEFARHRRAELECQLAQGKIERERREVMSGLAPRDPGPVSNTLLMNASRYLMGLEVRLSRLGREEADKRKERETAEAVFLEARRKRQALEQVREQRFQAWTRQENRRELRRLDEIGVRMVERRER